VSRPETEGRPADDLYPDSGDHLDDNTLALIAIHEESDAARSYAQAHIAHCPSCRQLVYAALDADAEPPAGDQDEEGLRPTIPIPRRSVLRWVSAAAALAGVVISGWGVFRVLSGIEVPASRPAGIRLARTMGTEKEAPGGNRPSKERSTDPERGEGRAAGNGLEMDLYPTFDGEAVVLRGVQGRWEIYPNPIKVVRDHRNIYFSIPASPPGTVLVAVIADEAPAPLADVVRSAGLPEGVGFGAVDAWRPKVLAALKRSNRQKGTISTAIVP
jgi:hypothetical protein